MSIIGRQVTWDPHASRLTCTCTGEPRRQQQGAGETPEIKALPKGVQEPAVDKTNAVNKKQKAAKQQAAKANRQARKGKEVADAMEGYEVSIALLICTHQSNALQTTRE